MNKFAFTHWQVVKELDFLTFLFRINSLMGVPYALPYIQYYYMNDLYQKSVLICITFFLIYHSTLRVCVIGWVVVGLLSSDNQLFAALAYRFHISYSHTQNLSLESSTTLFSIPYLVHDFNKWKIQNKAISITYKYNRRNELFYFMNRRMKTLVQFTYRHVQVYF